MGDSEAYEPQRQNRVYEMIQEGLFRLKSERVQPFRHGDADADSHDRRQNHHIECRAEAVSGRRRERLFERPEDGFRDAVRDVPGVKNLYVQVHDYIKENGERKKKKNQRALPCAEREVSGHYPAERNRGDERREKRLCQELYSPYFRGKA